MGQRVNTVERMLRRNVSVEGECWVWTGAILNNGYGKACIEWRDRLAHRVFYEYFRGPIPAGHQVDHLCKNRACVNPGHLEAVTAQENNARSSSPSANNARKAQCIRGHDLFGKNLYRTNDGRRQCRICRGLKVATDA